MISFSGRMTELRDERQMSRVDLANALGWPGKTIEKLETGRITASKEQMKKLAEFFGVTEAYLRCESDVRGENNASWLNGNLEPEEDPAPRTPAKPPKFRASAMQEKEDGAVFNLLLKSDAFRTAVLEVLKSPEGRAILEKEIARQK